MKIKSLLASVKILFAIGVLGDSGSFTILTYNIAGLPEGLSGSNPSVNTPIIASRIGDYSIINVQEDFNYHDLLYSGDSHPYRTVTSGGVPFGSGLNTLSNYPWTDLQRVTWDACWFNQGDCLTPKGFTAMRMQIAEGVNIDIYNLHSEAGDTDLDFVARKIGLEQLSNFIDSYSQGNAIIMFGDTNTRYYQANDVIRIFGDNNGMTDVWVELERGGTPPEAGGENIECPFPVPAGDPDLACEIVDKVLYRSSSLVKLTPTNYINENNKFLKDDGGPLSDHVPISVPFNWETSETLKVSTEMVGGTQDTWFNDLTVHQEDSRVATRSTVTTFSLRSGYRLDKITYTLSDSVQISHGGEGGNKSSTLSMQQGEKIVEVETCAGTGDEGQIGIFYLRVKTDRGRELDGGLKTPTCKVWNSPGSEWGLAGFRGRSGTEVDSLGVIWGKVSPDRVPA